ncbi:MAG: hypothetical protein M3X11_14260 [Acidobacteriota bacterium]|nr:hypothetical protein [Acidobacteriota bacterium]
MPHTYQIIDDDDFDPQDDLRPEYDFAALREADRARGIEYRRMFVRLEPDVAAAFPDGEAVNMALRELLAIRRDNPELRP